MHVAAGTGRVVAGRYLLQDPIGRGAMGVVWRARDSVLARDVAVKEVRLRSQVTTEERRVLYERTLREARTAARLNHPAVVTVYDVIEADGSPWIVMELVQARSLERIVAEDGPLAPRQAADVGMRVLGALASAHAAGIMHRDVKPSNVLIAGDGRAVLTDFGIATLEGDSTLTQTGMVMGTPGFTAPERVRGDAAGTASDLWSLGATLYAAVEGRGPFDDRGSSMAILSAIANEEPPRPRAAGPLAPAIEALLRRNPWERPDAAAAGRLLAAASGGIAPAFPASAFPAPVTPAKSASGPRPAAPPAPAAAGPALGLPPGPGPATPATADPAAGRPAPPGPASSRGGTAAFSWNAADFSGPATTDPAAADTLLPAWLDQPVAPGLDRPGPAAEPPAWAKRAMPEPPAEAAAGRPASGPPAGRTPAELAAGRRHGAARPPRRWGPLAGIGAVVIIGAGVLGGFALRHLTASPAGNTAGHSAGAPSSRSYTVTGAQAGTREGFTIAVPAGWRETRHGATTEFTDPAGSRSLEVTPTALGALPARAVLGLDQARALQRGSYPGYQRIGVHPFQFAGGTGAGWEFTWQPAGRARQEVLWLAVRMATPAGRQSYVLRETAPVTRWKASQPVFQQALDTFRPHS